MWTAATYNASGDRTTDTSDLLRSIREVKARLARSRASQPDSFVLLRGEANKLAAAIPGGRSADTFDTLCGLPVYLAETPDEARAVAMGLRMAGKRPALVGMAAGLPSQDITPDVPLFVQPVR